MFPNRYFFIPTGEWRLCPARLTSQTSKPTRILGELETILQRVLAGEAIIVYFNTLNRSNLPSESEIRSVPGILIIKTLRTELLLLHKRFNNSWR